MNRLLKWSIHNPFIIVVIFISLIVTGIFSYFEIDKQENPDFEVYQAIVTTPYPGADSAEVEKKVTNILEDDVDDLSFISEFESTSKAGASVITVTLKEEEKDADASWQKLLNKIDESTEKLPKGAKQPQINTSLNETALMVANLSYDVPNWDDIRDISKDLTDGINDIPGIKSTEVIGLPKRELKVELDKQKLDDYTILWTQVYQTLNEMDASLPEGDFPDGDTISILNTETINQAPEKIQSLPVVKRQDDATVTIDDIATVGWNDMEADTSIMANSQKSISIVAYPEDNIDLLKTGEQVENDFNEWEKDLSNKYSSEIMFNQSDNIDHRFTQLSLALIIGMIVAVIVCLLGLSFQSSLLATITIPMTLIISMFFMNLWGMKLQQISLASLILVLGILIDDVIVTSENIETKLYRYGKKPNAYFDGVKQVSKTVLISSLTIIIGFFPMYFFAGETGRFIKAIPQVILITLLVSTFLALFLIPPLRRLIDDFHANREMKKTRKKVIWEKVQHIYQAFLTKVLKRFRFVSIGLLLVTTALISLLTLLNIEFFPEADRNHIILDVEMPSGTNKGKTEDTVNDVLDRFIESDSRITDSYTYIGRSLPRLYYNEVPLDFSPSNAQVLIKTDHSSKSDVLGDLKETFKGYDGMGNITVRQFVQGPPVEEPIQIRITGDSMNELEQMSTDIKTKMKSFESIFNERKSLEGKQTEYNIDLDRDEITQDAITPEDVALTVRLASKGLDITNVYPDEGETGIPLNLYMEGNINNSSLLELRIPAAEKAVALNEIATIDETESFAEVTHYDGKRSATITGYIDENKDQSSVVNTLEEELQLLSDNSLDLDYTLLGGEKERNDAFSAAYKYFVISIGLIFILILYQFNSLIKPAIVMTTVYMAISGSILGLFITDQPLGFMSILGMIGLSGIVIRNGMMFIEFADIIKDQDQNGIYHAVLEAGKNRIRPILLTSVTGICGLLPMVILGGPLWKPLAITMIGGLIMSTLLMLVLVPTLYYWIYGRNERKSYIE